MKIRHKGDYKKYRRAAYPDIDEQMGALWKVIEHLQKQGIDIGQEGSAMLGQINQVKKRYKKQ